jgi:hypothetical protein
MTIKRKDTPENRAFWEHVEKVAAHVRGHNMCFSSWCVVTGESRCEHVIQRDAQGAGQAEAPQELTTPDQILVIAKHMQTRSSACRKLAALGGPQADTWEGLATELDSDVWALVELAEGRDVRAFTDPFKREQAKAYQRGVEAGQRSGPGVTLVKQSIDNKLKENRMGQAFDEGGNVLGEAFGDTKREVFDSLAREHKDAAEIRIRSLSGLIGQKASDPGGASAEMPRYRSHKEVWALKIERVQLDIDDARVENRETDGSARLFVEEPYATVRVTGEYVRKHQPQAGGYYVVYKDGYQSFSPAEAFEEGYTRLR